MTAPLGALAGKCGTCVFCFKVFSKSKLVSAKVSKLKLLRKPCGHCVCTECVNTWLTNEIRDKERSTPRCLNFQECDGCFGKKQVGGILGHNSGLYETLVALNSPQARGLRDGTLMYCSSGCNAVVQAQ